MYDEDVRSESFREHLSPAQRAELERRERAEDETASRPALRMVGAERARLEVYRVTA